MSDQKYLLNVLENIIHEKTQFPDTDNIAYLTVSKIGKITEPGALDFGGSEYNAADIKWLEAKKHSDEDKYGWWDLNEDMYLVEYNEKVQLDETSRVLIQLWTKALKAGISHPTLVITESRDPLQILVTVSKAGIDIKENARLSEIRMI
ncbi:MAG: dCTP deaminase [Aliifodinibius sp.]|nr:dCTP deaminase [Fodinibius sp.]NIW48015.1 dCTP deaminase [Gammaproteobacteria bacterium]NIX58565.1 dCTP deaminase [candidate division Zixibacteria bacterium]NIY28933.1 dCTP deaminase [Fodinibius sp.]